MTESSNSKLLDEFGKRPGSRTEMIVYLLPDVVMNCLDDLFGTPCLFDTCSI